MGREEHTSGEHVLWGESEKTQDARVRGKTNSNGAQEAEEKRQAEG